MACRDCLKIHKFGMFLSTSFLNPSSLYIFTRKSADLSNTDCAPTGLKWKDRLHSEQRISAVRETFCVSLQSMITSYLPYKAGLVADL
jgi:hypothetical protein